jgi:hypothetical protein
MKKRIFFVFFIVCCIPILYRALPIVHSDESFRSFFPKEAFQKKLRVCLPDWMRRQIDADLRGKTIDSERIEKTYRRILSTEQKKTTFHYRILDGKLYKYAAPGISFGNKDLMLEKSLKTLLIYTKIPDLDFLLSTLDGIAEPYVQEDFYLTERPEDQAPILAVAKVRTQPGTKHVILIPDHLSLSDLWMNISSEVVTLSGRVVWEEKRPIALWRGGLTDIGQVSGSFVPHFRSCPRFLLCKLSQHVPLWIDAGLSWVDDAMRSVLEREHVVKSELSKQEHLAYKYLPCLDGHMCTYPGYQWRLLSGSVTMKQESEQVQWFYGALQPFVHYIPIRNDISDLVEKVIWARTHDAETKKIAEEAYRFALSSLLPEDNYLYLYQVLQQYALLQKINFTKVKKETRSDPRWKCIQYRKQRALVKSWKKLWERMRC